MRWFKSLVCHCCGLVAEDLNQCEECGGTYCDTDIILHQLKWCPVMHYRQVLALVEEERKKWSLF
jgi:methionyl-tRNA synthetase